MEIGRQDVDAAVRRGVLSQKQADALWRELTGRRAGRGAAPFEPRHALLLAAGLVAAAPAALALLVAWERWGGAGGFAVSALVGIGYLASARALGRRAAAVRSVLVTAAVALVPFAVMGALHWAGVGDAPGEDLGAWLVSHDALCLGATAAAACLALQLERLPAMTALLAVIAWLAAMSAAPAIFGGAPSWSQRALLSTLVGVAALAAGFVIDGRTRVDHAGWLYLSGLAMAWGGLTTYEAASSSSLALYGLVCAWLVGLGLVLHRRAFAVFGAIGMAGLAGRIADALLVPEAVPFVVVGVSIALVAAAAVYLEVEADLGRRLTERLPSAARRLLPPGLDERAG